jgi:filamentous hemagglutinin
LVKTITGRFNYVVTEAGKLVVGRTDSQIVGGGHIDLAGGKPVQAAGEVLIVKGKVLKVNNASGHYRPRGVSARVAAEKAFRDAGFDATGKYTEVY